MVDYLETAGTSLKHHRRKPPVEVVMSYLFSDHQRAMAPLLFPGVGADSEAFRAAAALPKLPDPPMVAVHKPVSELTVGLLASLGARESGQEPFERTNDLSYRLISRSVPSEQIVFDHATDRK